MTATMSSTTPALYHADPELQRGYVQRNKRQASCIPGPDAAASYSGQCDSRAPCSIPASSFGFGTQDLPLSLEKHPSTIRGEVTIPPDPRKRRKTANNTSPATNKVSTVRVKKVILAVLRAREARYQHFTVGRSRSRQIQCTS